MLPKKLSPIVLFTYNRPELTEKTINSLQKNILASDSDLIIFSDDAKERKDKNDVEDVRKYFKNIDGFKSVNVILRDRNFGLANNIIDGVSSVISKYGKVIVLEDDLITSEYFLRYMNSALEIYYVNKEIFSISGYVPEKVSRNIPVSYKYDVFLNLRNSSTGWGTWKDRWMLVDWEVTDYDRFKNNKLKIMEFNESAYNMSEMLGLQMEGKIDSWAIRFDYAMFENNCYSIAPKYSYVKHIGYIKKSTHSRKQIRFTTNLEHAKKNPVFLETIELNQEILKIYKRCFHRNIFYRILKKIYSFFFKRKIKK